MPTHSETRFMPYPPQALYALVADVARYPEFLPWCSAARIRRRMADPEVPGREIMEADLVISFKLFRERFGSRVILDPEGLKIDTSYIDGPFRHMRSHWSFEPAEGGCNVSFDVDFEFRNAMLQRIIGLVFNEAMQRIVRAFEQRAAALHGRTSLR